VVSRRIGLDTFHYIYLFINYRRNKSFHSTKIRHLNIFNTCVKFNSLIPLGSTPENKELFGMGGRMVKVFDFY
jgi:hypothetical protein